MSGSNDGHALTAKAHAGAWSRVRADVGQVVALSLGLAVALMVALSGAFLEVPAPLWWVLVGVVGGDLATAVPGLVSTWRQELWLRRDPVAGQLASDLESACERLGRYRCTGHTDVGRDVGRDRG